MTSVKTYIKRIGYLVISLIILSACRPRGVLSSKKMEDIFVDLHTAEGIIQAAGYNYGHTEETRGYYQMVLAKHGVTQAQFDSSLVWYTANPTIFDKIYPKVVERLQTQLNDYVAKLDVEQARPKYDLDQWLNICQYGLDRPFWPKKYEKKPTKFVYIKN